jgi:apurinic endonuclease APN1
MTITRIYFGAHTSIAKGVLNGIKYISDIGGNVSQIFLGNRLSSQLKSKTKLNEDEKKEIIQYLKENDHKLFVHAAYVLNLASKPPTSSSIQYQLDSLRYDLELGDQIGSSGLVIHLGNQMKLDKEEAYQNMVSCVMKVIDVSKGNGRILLETSAGAGTQIGVGLDDFAKLWSMFPKEYHSRLGVCVDTAHIFSAGIPINNPSGVKKYFSDFDEKIGLKHLKLVHLNDSKAVFNARVDRHENLEQGYIFDSQKNGSSKALQTILAFLVKHQIPALLETPGDGSLSDNESGSYQYQLQMIKDLVNDYKKLPNPSINLTSKYATKFSRKLSRTQSSRFINILKKSLKIKSMSQKGGKSAAADLEPNKSIIRLLMEMGNLLKIRKDIFRSRALQTASIILREYNQKITSSEQLKGIPRIGQGIRDKVDEYLKTGKIQDIEDLKMNMKTSSKFKSHKTKVKDELETILGIGPSESLKLTKLGIKSIEDLKEKVEKGVIELNHQQLIGLKYYKDLDIDIPRKDAHQIVLAIEKNIKTSKEHLEWKDLEIIHAGSYPSGKKASKDIDILMFDPRIKTRMDLQKSTLLIDVCNYLEKEKLILETLSLGTTKFLGVVPSSKKSNYVKHLDIRLIPTESRITAYFFYTSGGKFNQMIRQVAKDKGFMLSEFELKDKTGKTVHVESEEDIFKALGLKFMPMSDRREL